MKNDALSSGDLIGIFTKQSWWQPTVIYTTVFSGIIIILFLDGILKKLVDKGVIGLLINIVIIVVLFIL